MAKTQFSNYTELRAQVNGASSVTITDGILSLNTTSEIKGVSARVYREGNYGFASIPDYSEEGIRKILKAAEDNANFLYSKNNVRKKNFTPYPKLEKKVGFNMEEILEQSYVIELTSKIDEYIKDKYKDLVSRTVGARILNFEKLYRNTDGVFSHSFLPRSMIMVEMVLMGTDNLPVSLYKGFGGLGSFMDLHKKASDYYEELDILYKNLKDKAEGVYCKGGIKEVILDAELAGILAHEAIGHTTEADLVRAGSVAGKLLNKEVASPLITLVDVPHHVGDIECPVPVYVDDEGVEGEDVVIIENGILKSYMHNKESAMDMGFKAQGNARANAYYDEPLIRMRNTCIIPGKSKLEDMISSIDDGYYFLKTTNGQADSTAEFMFGVAMGYEIKNGKLGKALRDTTISGMAFDVLKNATMVSDELKWLNGGWCGKKQVIIVGMGGPAIKTKVNVGGR